MNQGTKHFLILIAVTSALVAGLHGIHVFFNVSLAINEKTVPLWASWVITIIAGSIAYHAVQLAEK